MMSLRYVLLVCAFCGLLCCVASSVADDTKSVSAEDTATNAMRNLEDARNFQRDVTEKSKQLSTSLEQLLKNISTIDEAIKKATQNKEQKPDVSGAIGALTNKLNVAVKAVQKVSDMEASGLKKDFEEREESVAESIKRVAEWSADLLTGTDEQVSAAEAAEGAMRGVKDAAADVLRAVNENAEVAKVWVLFAPSEYDVSEPEKNAEFFESLMREEGAKTAKEELQHVAENIDKFTENARDIATSARSVKEKAEAAKKLFSGAADLPTKKEKDDNRTEEQRSSLDGSAITASTYFASSFSIFLTFACAHAARMFA